MRSFFTIQCVCKYTHIHACIYMYLMMRIMFLIYYLCLDTFSFNFVHIYIIIGLVKLFFKFMV